MNPIKFGKPPKGSETTKSLQRLPDWKQSNPKWIKNSLNKAISKPSGGWHVIDATESIGTSPCSYWVEGRELVVWRSGSDIFIAPNACPHLGASLADGHIADGNLVCPWHGLHLDCTGHGAWRPIKSYDDGVLLWVQLNGEEALSTSPYLCRRPENFISATIRMLAKCEPVDIIANRLDPWHGVHYHPNTFRKLKVIDIDEEKVTVRVTYKASNWLNVEVDARFDCPDPRTIVMTIIDGEGTGSVVETHATRMRSGQTSIIETTLVTSERNGFKLISRRPNLVKTLIQKSAKKLWQEDAAYAERRYALRTGLKDNENN